MSRLEWSVARTDGRGPGRREVAELHALDADLTRVRLSVRATRPNLRMRVLPAGVRVALTLQLRLQLDGLVEHFADR